MRVVHTLVLVCAVQAAFVALRMASILCAIDMRVSGYLVGAIIAFFSLLPTLLAIRTGRWLDAVGWRRPAGIGIALLVCGVAVPAILDPRIFGYEILVACALASGAGLMCFQTATQNLIGQLHSREKRVAGFSKLALAYSVAAFIGSVLCGWAVDSLDYQGTFRAILALLGVAGLMYLAPKQAGPGVPAQQAALHSSAAGTSLLSIRPVRNVLVLSAIISMTWDVEAALIPIYGRELGLAATEIGIVLGCLSVATFLVRLSLPALAARFSEWHLLLACVGISALACTAIPLTSSFAGLAAITFVLGLGLGAAQPNILALLHSVSPSARVGEAHGIRIMLMNGSHAVFPIVLGTASGLMGSAVPFMFMAMLLGGSVAFGLRAGSPDCSDQASISSKSHGQDQ